MRPKTHKMGLALAAVLLLSACATILEHEPHLGAGEITSEMLLDAAPLRSGAAIEDVSQIDILEINPEMLQFLDQHIAAGKGSYARLYSLMDAVMGSGELDLVYDETTLTAAGTFESGRGNCLSFTNLFIALAREIGLDARYQEVEIQPLWSMSGTSFQVNLHVNVHVDLGPSGTHVVDFNVGEVSSSEEQQIISDARARAHYFNNIGVEKMLEEETQLALAHFRQSLLEDGSFTPAWVNFGNLYRRKGYASYAEAAFLTALQTDPSSQVAMSNLEALYRTLGETGLAEDYGEQVKVHRQRNPYYWFHLAHESFTGGDYQGAIDQTRKAIRMHRSEPRFYSLLSFSYLMSGDQEAARRSMEHAEQLAREEVERIRYRKKLDYLFSQSIEN